MCICNLQCKESATNCVTTDPAIEAGKRPYPALQTNRLRPNKMLHMDVDSISHDFHRAHHSPPVLNHLETHRAFLAHGSHTPGQLPRSLPAPAAGKKMRALHMPHDRSQLGQTGDLG